jgi:hypothetical protein
MGTCLANHTVAVTSNGEGNYYIAQAVIEILAASILLEVPN